MEHTHTSKADRKILGSTLSQCACGARKWSDDRAIPGGAKDAQGWYVSETTPATKKEEARRRAIEMLETEGHGYDYNKQDSNDPLDSHDPRNQD